MESYEAARSQKDSYRKLSDEAKAKKIKRIFVGKLTICLILAINLYIGAFHDVLPSKTGLIRKEEDPVFFIFLLCLVGLMLIVFTFYAFWSHSVNKEIHLGRK